MTEPSRVLASARRRLPQHLALLEALVRTNSHADNRAGVSACLGMLSAALADLGFTTERACGSAVVGERSLRRDHLVASRAPAASDAPTILVLGHVDTVFPEDHPFALATAEDHWRGPGVIDMKGGLVTALLTFALLEELGSLDRVDWRVLLATDEEEGSPTARELLRQQARDVDIALCFEAARPCGGLVVQRRGLGEATIVVHGRSGHAGIDHDRAVNAFTTLCRFVVAAESLEASIDGLSVSPGGVVNSAPASLSSIPDRAQCAMEWRFVEAEAGRRALAELTSLAETLSRETGAIIEVQGQLPHPPMVRTPAVDDLIARYSAAASELGMSVGGVATAGVGDINEVAAQGVTCLDGVGPEGAGFHTTDEHLLVDSIPRRAAMNALALHSLLGSAGR